MNFWDDSGELVSKNIVIEILETIKEHVSDDNKALVENAITTVNRLSTVIIEYRAEWRGMDDL